MLSDDTRKMVKGFVHRPGFHCGSSALRDVFEFHGHKFKKKYVSALTTREFKYKYLKYKIMSMRYKKMGINSSYTRAFFDGEGTITHKQKSSVWAVCRRSLD